MILFIGLLFLPILSFAEPYPESLVYAIDSIEGILYEIPEDEDPDAAMYQLSAMGVVPILTVLEEESEPEDIPSEGDSAYYDQLADTKKRLDDVILRLNLVKSALQKGDTHVKQDIEKSIRELKKMERDLRTDVYSYSTSMHKGISFSWSGGKPSVTTESEATVSMQTPIDSSTTDATNAKEEEVIDTPFGKDYYMTETKKIEDGEKAAYKKKWMWKSSNVF
ncbi:uncharacterized protein LOC118190386 [Stegodyphus dumicola]|uniref:uncharacterized protein LOC118190386 n=1 Tax=Stegodyphus dumicola TaxID=202533 RepID=UPI0015AD8598|nr:uncharacterized protein LOC118190386 [Stegodyphus dumicola]